MHINTGTYNRAKLGPDVIGPSTRHAVLDTKLLDRSMGRIKPSRLAGVCRDSGVGIAQIDSHSGRSLRQNGSQVVTRLSLFTSVGREHGRISQGVEGHHRIEAASRGHWWVYSHFHFVPEVGWQRAKFPRANLPSPS